MKKEIEILDFLEFRCEIAHRLKMDFNQDIFDIQDTANNIVKEKREILEFCKDKFISLNKLKTNHLEDVKAIECYYIEQRDRENLDEYEYVLFDTYELSKEYYDSIVKPKTIEDWNKSKEDYFDKFFKPGDIVGQDVVEYFVNALPPITFRDDFIQAGEPYSNQIDPEDKKFKATYITFEKGEDNWIYKGNCFKDKNYDITYENEEMEECEDLEQ